MKLRDDLEIDDLRLAEICDRFHIRELAVFGSVVRDDFGPDSDVDVVFVGRPEDSGEPWAFVAFKDELEMLFGRPVDVVPQGDVHWYIRDRVLSEARAIYVAA